MACGCEAGLTLALDTRHKALVITRLNETHKNHKQSPLTQNDNSDIPIYGYKDENTSNEHAGCPIHNDNSADWTDDKRSDEGVASFSCGQPDDITSEP